MLIDIVAIVLRETLEASVLLAVLLSVSYSQKISFKWVPWALFFGVSGAIIHGLYLNIISGWFNYAGQEVVYAILQLLIYGMVCFIVPLHLNRFLNVTRTIKILMVLIFVMALIREGSEIFVFYNAFLKKEAVIFSALTSGFIGLTIGMSVGVVAYYALVLEIFSNERFIQSFMLSLIAAGMVLQSTQLLIQVDWIAAGEPFWNSNSLISESSIVGQVIYAIFGYEATPSGIEVVVYVFSILIIVCANKMITKWFSKKEKDVIAVFD